MFLIVKLLEFLFYQKNKLKPVEFKIDLIDGPNNDRIFVIGAYDNSNLKIGEGTSDTKKKAENLAAKDALKSLNLLENIQSSFIRKNQNFLVESDEKGTFRQKILIRYYPSRPDCIDVLFKMDEPEPGDERIYVTFQNEDSYDESSFWNVT